MLQASLSAVNVFVMRKMSCKVLKAGEALLEMGVRFQQQKCALHKMTKETKFSPLSWGDKIQITHINILVSRERLFLEGEGQLHASDH